MLADLIGIINGYLRCISPPIAPTFDCSEIHSLLNKESDLKLVENRKVGRPSKELE
jgi:hypothetical protein